MCKAKVSIIVPIYNREKYLEDCVRSLMRQSLDNIEYVFVDDGSTDNSLLLLKKVINDYPKRLPLIKIIEQHNNRGCAASRQIGLDNISGEYVIHADSDDWVDSNMYELLLNKAEATNADIVGCNIQHEYYSFHTIFRQSYSDDMDENIRGLLNGKIFPSLCTSLTKTSLIRNSSVTFPTGLDTGEDLLFNLNLYLCAKSVKGLDAAPYHYRHTEDSGTYRLEKKNIDSMIAVSLKIESLFKEKGLYDKYKFEIIYRKFYMKCSLIEDFMNENNNQIWLNLFPDTHKYIWKFKQISWKRRLELWLASRNMFSSARLFQHFLEWQHSIRRL